MRISTRKGDPGYDMHLASKAKVFFKGFEIADVITADEEQRMLVRVKTDENGKGHLDPETNAVVTETLYGDVRIELGKTRNDQTRS